MPLSKLETYLRSQDVSFNKIVHHKTYTAQRTAADAHISGKEIAKTVIMKIDNQMSMVVLPGDMQIDIGLLKMATGAKNIRLATEMEFKDLFENCEVGAMPPFGNLYDMPVYVAEALREDVFIAFNAGTHSMLIQMKYADFERLVKPHVMKLAYHAHY
ncbi:aminoacyl-tRNA deacylase [Plebeiibacterium sediminum]|uniref:YbaK/EbsC family protein n=1 Tax=Plebeiibacterium sediminum TaxID=2992112 RepID=A0AAE3M858_9BACT|nr:YbaK/EbsC family protein [Plebeiobacterium sediminum]MCW3788767.1 YbaK/EbsC family protein [Plebeiobacterium sediminum]